MNIEVSWTELKTFLDTRVKATCQYVEFSHVYLIKAFDGVFEINCKLKKSEASEFETSYKDNCNKPMCLFIEPTAIKNPNGARARLKGVISTTATKNSATPNDWLIPQLQYPIGTNINSIFDGVQYYAKNASVGDSLKFQVVDKDGSGVGIGLYDQATYDALKDGNGVMLVEEFGDSWFIAPNTLEKILLYKARLFPGLYLRVVYNNVSATNDVEFFINLFRHVES